MNLFWRQKEGKSTIRGILHNLRTQLSCKQDGGHLIELNLIFLPYSFLNVALYTRLMCDINA